MNPVVLQGADHLQTGPVAHVGQARVFVAAEVTLEDSAFFGPIEYRSPGLQLADTGGRLLGMNLRHARVIHVLAAAHGVGKMDLPVVALIHVRERRRDPPFGHNRMSFTEQTLRNDSHGNARRRGSNGGTQSCSSRADDQNVVFANQVFRHQKILQSVQIPIEHILT